MLVKHWLLVNCGGIFDVITSTPTPVIGWRPWRCTNRWGAPGGDKYFNPSIKYLVQEDLVSWAENLFLKVRRVDLATTSWGSIFLLSEGREILRSWTAQQVKDLNSKKEVISYTILHDIFCSKVYK